MLARNEINIPLFLLIDQYCLRVADAAEFQPAATKADALPARRAQAQTHPRCRVSAGRIMRDEGCVKRAKRAIGTSGGGDCGGDCNALSVTSTRGWMDAGFLPGGIRLEPTGRFALLAITVHHIYRGIILEFPAVSAATGHDRMTARLHASIFILLHLEYRHLRRGGFG